jgi:hypothetical protein
MLALRDSRRSALFVDARDLQPVELMQVCQNEFSPRGQIRVALSFWSAVWQVCSNTQPSREGWPELLNFVVD